VLITPRGYWIPSRYEPRYYRDPPLLVNLSNRMEANQSHSPSVRLSPRELITFVAVLLALEAVFFSDALRPGWVLSAADWLLATESFRISGGPEFDPTDGDRTPSVDGMRSVRAYLGRRFPALADAPVLGAEVCQYENSPDGHFIIDRHPAMPDVWIAGGGSGHGYKMGPALGELLGRWVLDDTAPDPFFALRRFAI